MIVNGIGNEDVDCERPNVVANDKEFLDQLVLRCRGRGGRKFPVLILIGTF